LRRALRRAFESPDDVIGKTDFDLFPVETARVQLSLDSQTVHSAQADISTVSLGSNKSHLMMVRTPVFGVNGAVTGIDLRLIGGPGAVNAERVPLEVQELRASEQRFRHFATASADFFWELDANMKFRFVTDELESVLGIPQDSL